MAGSFQNMRPGEWWLAVRRAAASGTVKNARVSVGRRFSAGAMAARAARPPTQMQAAQRVSFNRFCFIIKN